MTVVVTRDFESPIFIKPASIEELAQGAERDGDTPKQADAFGLSATHQKAAELHGKRSFAAFVIIAAPSFRKRFTWRLLPNRKIEIGLNNLFPTSEAHETLASL